MARSTLQKTMLPSATGMSSPVVLRFFIYPVREHYLVFEPLAPRLIAIVAVIRQGRDIPAILQKWAVPIQRDLIEIRGMIERREIRAPARPAPKPRQKK